ncbi:MAG: membrane integrity-associated transporter subunit PqiC [Desulfobaccales bacterium]
MRVVPVSSALPFLLAFAALFPGGCSRSQTPRFYALSAIPEDQMISTRESQARNVVIGIGPVKLADYLDQSKLVTRPSDHLVVKAEYDRWAGPLKDNFVNVVADNLGALLGTERIYLYPWRVSLPLDYQVVLDIVRCDGRLGDAAWLEVRWSLFTGPEKKLLKTHRASIREPVTGADYGALVAAQSRALARLSQEIAAAILRGTGKNGG